MDRTGTHLSTPRPERVGAQDALRLLRAVAFAFIALAILGIPAPVIAQIEIPPDTGSAPSVAFVFPPDSSVVGGEFAIAVEASDTAGVISPAHFYIARASSDPGHLGQPIGGDHRHRNRYGHSRRGGPLVTETISAPGEIVVVEEDFDTEAYSDGAYRLSVLISNIYGHSTLVTETIEIDNTAPRLRLDRIRSGQGPGGRDDGDEESEDPQRGRQHLAVVTDSVAISGSVADANLVSWSAVARIGTQTIGTLGVGTAGLSHGHVGTYSAAMAPPGYRGPVELVFVATDSAMPTPNVSEKSRQVFSNYYIDAYGALDVAQRYEISATLPVRATIAGEVANWRLDVRRAGNSEALITRSGSGPGESMNIVDFDVANSYGPGTYEFDLQVTDTGGEVARDIRVAEFVWHPAHLAITYIGPPISGPGPDMPLSEFTDPTVSGIVEVRGEVSGSNTWAWALGRPIAVGEPSFAGEKMVFSSNIDDPNNFDIYQVDLDGTDLIRLTTNPGFDYAPQFSGDGARIVFSSTRDYSMPQAGTDIYSMSTNGTDIERLTSDGRSTSPSLSPGGTHVAFVRPEGIFELELSTGGVVQLTNGPDSSPDYSPDSTRLVFDRGIRGNQQIFVGDLTTPGYPVNQLITATVFSGEPEYSPDGTRIAYWADHEIFVAGADGQNQQSLGVTGTDPTWTPDASRIVYSQVPQAGPNKIYFIGSDPVDPGVPEELEIYGSSRTPDAEVSQVPFPPTPPNNPEGYAAIDIASFVRAPDPLTYWGYLRAPPDQLPIGARGPDSVLGYIDTSRLPPGVTSLSLTALQCPSSPSVFDYGLEVPPDVETSITTAAIATCNAYSTPQIPLRVLPKSASVDLRVDVTRGGAGYAGALSAQREYSATGAWFEGDAWAFSAPPLDGLEVPGLIRVDGRMWASGPPANAEPGHVLVGDLAALEDMDLVIGDPALGLKGLSGQEILPTPVACGELFAPGRTGCRYEVDIVPGHFGGATHVTAYSDYPTGLLGAITWSYGFKSPGEYAALPGPEGWGSALPPTQTNQVRLVFSGYGRDVALPRPVMEASP